MARPQQEKSSSLLTLILDNLDFLKLLKLSHVCKYPEKDKNSIDTKWRVKQIINKSIKKIYHKSNY